MLPIALSLMLIVQPPEPQESRMLDVALTVLGVGTPIGLFWGWVWRDAEERELAAVDGGLEPAVGDFVQNCEASVQGAAVSIANSAAGAAAIADEVTFPDIDWDVEPTQSADPAVVIHQQIIADLREQEKREHPQVPGEVDFDRISRIEIEERKAWLFDYFEQHDLLYLFKLLQATPIVVAGLERCGKNTFAMAVAALRRVFFPMPMLAQSPHANEDNPFAAFFCSVGYSGESDYRAIASRLRDLHRWVSVGDTNPLTMLWDESSRYTAKFHPDDRPLLSDFMRFLATECAKHEKFQIVLASGTTSACLPGSEGAVRDLNQGIVTIFRQVDEDAYGRKSPSSSITIESSSWKGSFQFPKWLNASWILRAFPEVNQPLPLPPSLAEVTSGGVEVATAREVPTTVAREVTSGGVEVREVEAGSGSNVIYFPTSNFPTSGATSALPDARKLLFLAIQPYLGSGKSITWIVQDLLKMKGRRFAEGKQLVESLIKEFGESK